MRAIPPNTKHTYFKQVFTLWFETLTEVSERERERKVAKSLDVWYLHFV